MDLVMPSMLKRSESSSPRLPRPCRSGLLPAVCAGAVMLLVGCSHQDRMEKVLKSYESGAYGSAATELEPVLESRRDSEKDRTLYELEAGAVYASAGNLEQSMAAFGAADERMWDYLDDAPDVRISEQVAAFVTDQTIITYTGRAHDRIMCCVYQALNHLQRNDLNSAGVSLKRALAWQEDAKYKYAEEIEKLQAKAEAEARSKSYDTNRSMNAPEVKGAFDSNYGPLRELKGYADFAIPYATFLQALRDQLTGRPSELAQATQAFRITAGMLPEKERAYVSADAALAERASGGAPLPPMVYVVVETGLGPELKQFRLDIPLFMREVPVVAINFPLLKLRENAAASFTARAGGKSYSSSVLTDMDSVVSGDFNRRLPAIIAVSIASSASKALATYFAQRAAAEQSSGAGLLVSVVGAVYQVGTNNADLRTWLTLPKKVLYARFPAPAEGPVEIELADGQKIGPIEVESKGATIVHVRTPRAGVVPAVRTMRFAVK